MTGFDPAQHPRGNQATGHAGQFAPKQHTPAETRLVHSLRAEEQEFSASRADVDQRDEALRRQHQKAIETLRNALGSNFSAEVRMISDTDGWQPAARVTETSTGRRLYAFSRGESSLTLVAPGVIDQDTIKLVRNHTELVRDAIQTFENLPALDRIGSPHISA